MEGCSMKKPTVELIGQNGNAYAILGICRRSAKEAGWTDQEIIKVLDEMMAGDYDHLLQTTIKYFYVK
jgi:hypothetical protein